MSLVFTFDRDLTVEVGIIIYYSITKELISLKSLKNLNKIKYQKCGDLELVEIRQIDLRK
jgi:hypothetical protein